MPPDPREVLAEDWLERARRDLLLARLALGDANLSGLAAFHGQQAAEKALKAYLARQDQPALRTHDLPALLARCVRFDGEFARIAEAARILDDYLTAGRYPDTGPDPTAAEAGLAVELAEAVVGFVRGRLLGPRPS